ncbi:hypothetical protein EGT71_01630 [Atlantibacter subterranea]|uniref:Uncharacterized protein n=1 Tax=Atlantibacter subterraneus TaxID=255519 RepID=A0A3R9GX00_9ENTR|nr:hypothetical protein [Atlantibacter subterranea]RSB64443.1 hypothetical protein EGK67_04430 [Atlantibacter subterranea]RSE07767.1 hypothetical protein EGT84_04355 [Atlantibacter subterranea]RSE29247.1 hypothetical protein EGT71_01630 [Atlantibacter subterranea]
MIDKYRLEELRRDSCEKGDLARWVIQLQKDLDDERRKATALEFGCAVPQVTSVPETLPCSVILEPGLRFGKGVRTQALLDALQRRATYYAELEAMTPEQLAERDSGIKEFAAMLAAPAVQAEQEPVGIIRYVDIGLPDTKGIHATFYAKLPEGTELFARPVQAEQLSGNTEPVSQPYTLPDWLQQAHKLAELYGTSFVVFRHGEEAQCADPTKVIISFTDEDLGHHSAAPKQEAQEVKK